MDWKNGIVSFLKSPKLLIGANKVLGKIKDSKMKEQCEKEILETLKNAELNLKNMLKYAEKVKSLFKLFNRENCVTPKGLYKDLKNFKAFLTDQKLDPDDVKNLDYTKYVKSFNGSRILEEVMKVMRDHKQPKEKAEEETIEAVKKACTEFNTELQKLKGQEIKLKQNPEMIKLTKQIINFKKNKSLVKKQIDGYKELCKKTHEFMKDSKKIIEICFDQNLEIYSKFVQGAALKKLTQDFEKGKNKIFMGTDFAGDISNSEAQDRFAENNLKGYTLNSYLSTFPDEGSIQDFNIAKNYTESVNQALKKTNEILKEIYQQVSKCPPLLRKNKDSKIPPPTHPRTYLLKKYGYVYKK